jgi:hypothetical protein
MMSISGPSWLVLDLEKYKRSMEGCVHCSVMEHFYCQHVSALILWHRLEARTDKCLILYHLPPCLTLWISSQSIGSFSEIFGRLRLSAITFIKLRCPSIILFTSPGEMSFHFLWDWMLSSGLSCLTVYTDAVYISQRVTELWIEKTAPIA